MVLRSKRIIRNLSYRPAILYHVTNTTDMVSHVMNTTDMDFARDKHDWYGKISSALVFANAHMFVLEVRVQYTIIHNITQYYTETSGTQDIFPSWTPSDFGSSVILSMCIMLWAIVTSIGCLKFVFKRGHSCRSNNTVAWHGLWSGLARTISSLYLVRQEREELQCFQGWPTHST